MTTELTMRARNVVRVELDRIGVSVGMSQVPDPKDVMKLDPKSFRTVPNCGASTMANISLWMLEQGFQWSPNLPWYPEGSSTAQLPDVDQLASAVSKIVELIQHGRENGVEISVTIRPMN